MIDLATIDLNTWLAVDSDPWAGGTFVYSPNCLESWVATDIDSWADSCGECWVAAGSTFCPPVEVAGTPSATSGSSIALPPETGVDCLTSDDLDSFSDDFDLDFATIGQAQATFIETYVNNTFGRSIKSAGGAILPAITVCRQQINLPCPAVQIGPVVKHPYNTALYKRICNKAAGKSS